MHDRTCRHDRTKTASAARLRWLPWVPAIVLGTSLVAGAPTAASAADVAARATAGPHAAATQGAYRAMRASKVIGMGVRNGKGEDLGKINDLVVDMNTGDVRYAILEFDPGIFRGETLFAVPTSKLRLGSERDELLYEMDPAQLEKVGVHRSKWSDTWRDPKYREGLDRSWGIRQPGTGASAMRVSDLLGKDVMGRSGDDEIGEIEDLVVNMAANKVHYVAFEFDPGWLSPEKLYALPLKSFRPAGDEKLRVDVDKSRLKGMKGFSESRLDNLNDRAWASEVDRYLVTVVPVAIVPGNRAGTSVDPGEIFDRLDANRDGYIDRTEAQAGGGETARLWKRIDANGDGRLSREEFVSAHR